ncbi:hypothetical protein ACVNPZ_11705 [Staphylococcus aureus]
MSTFYVTKLSAIPTLNFAIVFAVAGATIIASAQSPNARRRISAIFYKVSV